MLDEIASETVNKEEECDGRKRSKILKELYPVENINKNPLSFVVISLILQEVPLHTNWEAMQWVTDWLRAVSYFCKIFELRCLIGFTAEREESCLSNISIKLCFHYPKTKNLTLRCLPNLRSVKSHEFYSVTLILIARLTRNVNVSPY